MTVATAIRPRWLVPEVVQTSAMDCGPAALKCLLEGFRIPVSYGRLREACQTGIDGTSIDTLEEVANQLGVDAAQSMLPVDHLFLERAGVLPAMVVVRHGDGSTHFVVVWRRLGRLVQVMDPAIGRRWLRIDRFVEDLFAHEASVPAADWRAWAASSEFLAPLGERFGHLVATSSVADRLIGTALADPGWFPMATLDATVRLVARLVAAGGVTAGPEAARLIEGLFQQTVGSPDDIYTILPRDCWSVAPDPDSAALGERRVLLRGAVLVSVSGRSPAADGLGASPPLPPELAAALAEKAPNPLAVLLRMLLADGAVAPLAVLGAIGIATAAILVEMLLFRALFDLADMLNLGGHRLVAGLVLIAFMALALTVRIPIASEALRLGRRLDLRLRMALLSKLPRLSDRYFQSRPISDMADRGHSLHMSRAVPGLGLHFVQTCCELAAVLAGIACLDGETALWAMLMVLGLGGLSLLVQPGMNEADLRVRNHAGALHGFTLDALLGLIPIRVHRAQLAVRRRHESLLVEWARAMRRLAGMALVIEGAQQVAAMALVGLILFEHLQRGAGIGGGDLLLVYWLLKLPAAGQTLMQLAHQYPAQRNVLLRLLEPLAATSTDAGPASAPRTLARGAAMPVRIDIADGIVHAGGHAVLEALNLGIEPGEHVAIVGPSGAGKSSLVGLLLGWHNLSSGSLAVDGVPLTGASLEQLRRSTAWVDPGIQLWNRSLVENVGFGLDDPDRAAIVEALDSADLREVLQRLPDGLRSALGEGGGLLSGGEGQRVRLARALAQEHVRLAVLDEPFRGTDRLQRGRLLSEARRHWRDATLLCVTHDLSETLGFDRVLVVEHGTIVEDGAPARLAASPGRYAELLAAEAHARQRLWQGQHWRRLEIEDGHVRRPR